MRNTALIAFLGTVVLKLIAATYRFRYLNAEEFHRQRAGGGLILPFWHNRIIGACTAPIFRGCHTTVVVSRHFDGEIIARIQKRFGHRAIRGSPGKGGGEALEEMEREVNHGSVVGITPDGPRGPRYVVKRGTAALAVRTGRPVIPFLTAARRRWKFNSWDGFELPQPFSEITLVFGEPIVPEPDDDVEELRQRIEREMRRMVVEGEQLYGRKADLPAEMVENLKSSIINHQSP